MKLTNVGIMVVLYIHGLNTSMIVSLPVSAPRRIVDKYIRNSLFSESLQGCHLRSSVAKGKIKLH